MKMLGPIKITKPNYKRVPYTDDNGRANGFRSVPDGTITAQVTIYVDERLLAESIGWKAQKSKSGRSKLQGNAVMVECDWSKVEGAQS